MIDRIKLAGKSNKTRTTTEPSASHVVVSLQTDLYSLCIERSKNNNAMSSLNPIGYFDNRNSSIVLVLCCLVLD